VSKVKAENNFFKQPSDPPEGGDEDGKNQTKWQT
jgi:hypothetical protein